MVQRPPTCFVSQLRQRREREASQKLLQLCTQTSAATHAGRSCTPATGLRYAAALVSGQCMRRRGVSSDCGKTQNLAGSLR